MTLNASTPRARCPHCSEVLEGVISPGMIPDISLEFHRCEACHEVFWVPSNMCPPGQDTPRRPTREVPPDLLEKFLATEKLSDARRRELTLLKGQKEYALEG